MRGGCSGSPIAISCMMCFVLIISGDLMNTGSFLTEIRRRRTAIGKRSRLRTVRCHEEETGQEEVIAEDLGFLTPSVIRLVKKTGYPGMKILQFAFDAGSDSEYLPHNYDKNCVVYTGTHDNDTTVGFLQNMPEKDKKFAKKYLGHKKDRKLCFEIIRQHCPAVRIPQSFPCRIIWSWTAAPGSTLPPLWDATGNGVWIRMLWIRSLRKRFIRWQNYTEDCKVCRVA